MNIIPEPFRAVVAATRCDVGIGHNGGPRPFGLRAKWLRFVTDLELRRLARLSVWISRRERGLADLKKERGRIMNRCIRRMRRIDGKN